MIGLGQKKYAHGLMAIVLISAGLFAFVPETYAVDAITVSDCDYIDGGTGTGTSATASNLDTVSISGLTAQDTLSVYWAISTGANAVGASGLYHDTDGLFIARVLDWDSSTSANRHAMGEVLLRQSASSSTEILNISNGTVSAFVADAGYASTTTATTAQGSETVTTAWTGTWTLALRHGTNTGGGTISYSWSVYKCSTPSTSTVASLPADADGYLRNNGSGTLSWDNASTVKTFLSLSNVENTALSTWAGSTNLTTLGTITTGTWTGSDITDTYLDLTAWTGSTALTTLGTITTGTWTGTIIDSAYLDISGSGSLPGDAEGFLFNDGAGALSWSPASAGDTIVEDESMDVLAVILYFGAFLLVGFVTFYKNL